ncbi:MAG: S-layer homology domain-containing protein [Oscillospiraceae bacterium]|nr:S-layer homology domain-containing protein [Oscillospiraceae bacterium]
MRNLKKILAFTLAFAMVLSLGFTALAAKWTDELYPDWDDVGANYKDAVKRLSTHEDGLNVFRAYNSAGDFAPGAELTRAQMIAIAAIVDIGGNPDGKDLNDLFTQDANRGQAYTDVPAEHWAYAAINYATRMGYVEGNGGGTFSPEDPMTSDAMYSLMLSLLGFTTADKNGPDWIDKVGTLMRVYDLRAINAAANFNITREEAALVLSKAVDSNMFQSNGDGTYTKLDAKLIAKFSGANKKEAGSYEIMGKVIKAGWGASLFNAENWPQNDVAILARDGKIYQLRDATSVVPIKYLGREIKIDIVDVGGTAGAIGVQLVRAAAGTEAVPVWTNDVIKVPGSGGAPYNAYNNTYWYNNAHSGYAQLYRGSYLGYTPVIGTWEHDANWAVPAIGDINVNWAYAIQDPNTKLVTEVFYLQYQTMRVRDITRDGLVVFEYLDGCFGWRQPQWNMENGYSIAKDDIVVGVLRQPLTYGSGYEEDYYGQFMTVEVIPGVQGFKCPSHGGTCMVIDGQHSGIASTLVGGVTGDWNTVCGDGDKGIQNHDTFSFMPYYSMLLGNYYNGINGVFYTDCFATPRGATITQMCGHTIGFTVSVNEDGEIILENAPAANVYYLQLDSDAGVAGLLDPLKNTYISTGTAVGGVVWDIGVSDVLDHTGGSFFGWTTNATDRTSTDDGSFIVAIAVDNHNRLVDWAISEEIDIAGMKATLANATLGIPYTIAGATATSVAITGTVGEGFKQNVSTIENIWYTRTAGGATPTYHLSDAYYTGLTFTGGGNFIFYLNDNFIKNNTDFRKLGFTDGNVWTFTVEFNTGIKINFTVTLND